MGAHYTWQNIVFQIHINQHVGFYSLVFGEVQNWTMNADGSTPQMSDHLDVKVFKEN